MNEPYDTSAPKKAANVSVNSDLLRQARALDINLSRALEERLAQLVQTARRRRWLEENGGALNAQHDLIARHGVFSDGRRRF